MGIQFSVAFFLGLQATIAFAAGEVAYRYSRWWVDTRRSQGLMLRSLIGGIAITHSALVFNALVWIREKFVHPTLMDSMMTGMSFSYSLSNLARLILLCGIMIHMIPIWVIVRKYNYRQVLLAIAIRLCLACAVYFGALYAMGLLPCYLESSLACHDIVHPGTKLGGFSATNVD